MNIGIVSTWFERGAAYVSRAYSETLSGKHNVFVYARGGETYGINDPNWDFSNVTWEKKDERIPLSTFINWNDFKIWLDNNLIEMIIFNEQQSWDIILKLHDKNYLIGTYIDFYTKQTIPFFELYDFLLCNTRRHFSIFNKHPQCYFIPWGTDTEICKPQKKFDPKENIVFFHSAGMGGINFRKGTDILVKAFQKIKGNVKLIIHSQVDINYYYSIYDLIQKDPRIEFIIGTYPLPGLYHKGNVYVYPTKLEGIGLSIPEAMSCGLPVITTDCAPMNEFVFHDQNGLLIEVSEYIKRNDNYFWPENICSEESLIKAMQFYVDNPTIISEHSANARKFAVENLSWKNNSKDLPQLVNQVNEKRSSCEKLLWQVKEYEKKAQVDVLIKNSKKNLTRGRKRQALNQIINAILVDYKSVISKLINHHKHNWF